MAKISVAVAQTVWDCRWSRPGCRIPGVDESKQPESVWVCIRTGARRAVINEECEQCPHWEATDRPAN
jgi:hypothetical protein